MERMFPYWVAIMIISKLTSRAQTTIPKPVRAALHLKEGDAIAYQIEGDRVILARARGESVQTPPATFSEWTGDADRLAYATL